MRYRLNPRHPAAHLFEVALEIDAPDRCGPALRLPAWTPGSYMIRDCARHVVDLAAEDAAGDVAAHKTDKQTWVCAPANGRQVSTATLTDRAARLARDDATPLRVFRGDRLVELGATPAAPPVDTACLAWVAEPGAEAVAPRDAWLGAAA